MLEVKYTKAFQHKLEDIFAESDFVLRYEKGGFKSGYCILKDTKIVLVNNFFPLEGKINSLIEILKSLEISEVGMNEKNKKLLSEIRES